MPYVHMARYIGGAVEFVGRVDSTGERAGHAKQRKAFINGHTLFIFILRENQEKSDFRSN